MDASSHSLCFSKEGDWTFSIPLGVVVTGETFTFKVKGPIEHGYSSYSARLTCKETVLWSEYEGAECKSVGRECTHYKATSKLVQEDVTDGFCTFSGSLSIPASAPGTCVGGSIGRVEHVLEIVGILEEDKAKGKIITDTEIYVAHAPRHALPAKAVRKHERHTVTLSGEIDLDVVVAPRSIFSNRTVVPTRALPPATRW